MPRGSGWLSASFACACSASFLVATLHVGFLPPMEEWYSGLIPYPTLVVSQLVLIGLFGTICLQFSRGVGWFVRPRARLGDSLFVFGALYLGVMVLRYVLRMGLYPPERWWEGPSRSSSTGFSRVSSCWSGITIVERRQNAPS